MFLQKYKTTKTYPRMIQQAFQTITKLSNEKNEEFKREDTLEYLDPEIFFSLSTASEKLRYFVLFRYN